MIFIFISSKVFWEKRLQGLQACDVQLDQLISIQLPSALKAIGPDVEDQTVLQVYEEKN